MGVREGLLLIALTVAVTSAWGAPAIQVDLLPHVVMVGGTLRLTCIVQRNPRNRLLRYGITQYAPNSERDMNGEDSPIHFPSVYYAHIPCDAGDAYCQVFHDDGSSFLAHTPIQVMGCEGH